MDTVLNDVAKNLAQNVVELRKKRGLTQAALAKVVGLPRSTINYLESGAGNPSLQNLTRLSLALQVSIEELLSQPRGRYRFVKNKEVPSVPRGNGTVRVFELLPEAIPGMHIDRMEFEPGGRMGGIPHVTGTKEYLTCILGEVTLRTGGQIFRIQKGDVVAFPGDQSHSYENTSAGRSTCVSVVVLAPAGF